MPPELCLRVRLKTAGVDQEKSLPVPLHLAVIAIPGHPRQVIHNGLSFPCQAVEQGRFSRVRPPDDSQNRQRARTVVFQLKHLSHLISLIPLMRGDPGSIPFEP